MGINVFKFGGASVSDANGVRNVVNILQHFREEKIAIVVSATGKTTNQLEEVVNAYYHSTGMAVELLNKVKQNHIDIINNLGIVSEDAIVDIMDNFVEIDWLIEDEVHDPFDYIYDQIVSVGELVSSKILYHYLKEEGFAADWLDIRGALFTDEIHREAKVDWEKSTDKIKAAVRHSLEDNSFVVTQGFIGSTSENHTTTLGREGSDYTAAIISFCTDAEGMHIWKDVPGVLTADPRSFDNVTKLDRLSYKEAIEMTYYGAKVIHPKTIKPLQNKSIPLFVRPFGDYTSTGTIISGDGELSYPPIIVLESGQCLINISVKDFSFVAEHHMSNIFKKLADLRMKVNMMRNTAISFTLCVQYQEEKVNELIESLKDQFTIQTNKDLELITIRHFQESTVNAMKSGKITMFEERLNDMVQIVVKDLPEIKRKEN